MKLEFWYAPTADLPAALTLYRDQLGWTEAWREGDSTVSLRLPGTDVQLMLDEADATTRPGPIFVVGSVAEFCAGRPSGLRLCAEPEEIPGGFMAIFEDLSGNVVYVMDQSTESG